MTNQLPRENWKKYFDDLSREMLGWETTVKVFNDENGAQTLNTGLPFAGATFEDDDNGGKIELMMTADVDEHQGHSIFEPTSVAYNIVGDEGNSLSIEDKSGTKTLITFAQPFPVLASYSETAIVISE